MGRGWKQFFEEAAVLANEAPIPNWYAERSRAVFADKIAAQTV